MYAKLLGQCCLLIIFAFYECERVLDLTSITQLKMK